jgi:hypothetical protein
MTTPRDPEALLSAYLADGMEILPDRVADAVLDEIHRTRQRAMLGPWRTRYISWTGFAAAVVVGAVAVSGALFVIQRGLPAVAGPSQTPSPDPSASQAAVASPSATPSPTPTPIHWTDASLAEDWPAPVRAEPHGGAPVESIVVKRIPVDSESCCLVYEPGRSIDPTGDVGSDALPWLDISEVTVETYRVTINLASVSPQVGPTEQWIAYGVVFDDDRDGVPDRRFGIDNPVDPEHGHRTWMTDLHTGQTLVSDGAHIGGAYIDTFYPGELRDIVARFNFGGDTPRGPMGMELDNRPFYVWASVIQDGRVVATDYAPDAGWLKPSVQTKP